MARDRTRAKPPAVGMASSESDALKLTDERLFVGRPPYDGGPPWRDTGDIQTTVLLLACGFCSRNGTQGAEGTTIGSVIRVERRARGLPELWFVMTHLSEGDGGDVRRILRQFGPTWAHATECTIHRHRFAVHSDELVDAVRQGVVRRLTKPAAKVRKFYLGDQHPFDRFHFSELEPVTEADVRLARARLDRQVSFEK